MAVGRSISARVPHGLHPGQTTAWLFRASSTVTGKIASEGRCDHRWQQAGNWRKAEKTLSQLKDPKWKQLVKRFQGFVKRFGSQKDVTRSANFSTATVWPVKAARSAPVKGVAVPKVSIWERRNLPPPPPLQIDKV